MSAFELLIRGLLAGLIIAAPVGPVNVLCISRTLSKGRRSGLVSGLGAAAADTFYGSIAGFGITQNKLAVSIGVPPRRINEIVHGKRAITADTALRLGKFFGTSAQFWLNLQAHYDLDLAEDRAAEQIDAIAPLITA